MDLKQLETFLRVADAGSFSRAAAHLGMAQPSLSKQIRLLEVELHQNLFDRNGRGVTLTDAGKCLQEHAQAVLATVERTRDAMAAFRSTEGTGRVIVGLPPRIARSVTVPLVEAFKSSFPKATLSIAEALSVNLREWLSIGKLDLAVLFEPVQAGNLDLEPVSWEELVFVANPRARARLPERMSFAQAARYPLILPQMPHTTRALLEAAAHRTGVDLQIAAEVDTLQAITELVARLDVFSIVPRGVLALVPGQALVSARIHSPTMRAKVVLASSRQRPLTPLAQQTRTLLLRIDLAGLIGMSPAR